MREKMSDTENMTWMFCRQSGEKQILKFIKKVLKKKYKYAFDMFNVLKVSNKEGKTLYEYDFGKKEHS